MIVTESWRKPSCTKTEERTGFGSEGWLLASGSKDRTVRIWGTSKGRQLLLLKLPAPGRRDRGEEGGKGRAWLTLRWLQDHHKILSSSQRSSYLPDKSEIKTFICTFLFMNKTYSRRRVSNKLLPLITTQLSLSSLFNFVSYPVLMRTIFQWRPVDLGHHQDWQGAHVNFEPCR